jgi:hypothetical protein
MRRGKRSARLSGSPEEDFRAHVELVDNCAYFGLAKDRLLDLALDGDR